MPVYATYQHMQSQNAAGNQGVCPGWLAVKRLLTTFISLLKVEPAEGNIKNLKALRFALALFFALALALPAFNQF